MKILLNLLIIPIIGSSIMMGYSFYIYDFFLIITNMSMTALLLAIFLTGKIMEIE